jgi:hypothetical protein
VRGLSALDPTIEPQPLWGMERRLF